MIGNNSGLFWLIFLLQVILQNEAQVCHAPLHSHYLGQPGSSSANSSSNSSFGGVIYDNAPNSSSHFLFDESQNSSCSNSNSKPRQVYEVMEYMNFLLAFDHVIYTSLEQGFKKSTRNLNPTMSFMGRAKQVNIAAGSARSFWQLKMSQCDFNFLHTSFLYSNYSMIK